LKFFVIEKRLARSQLDGGMELIAETLDANAFAVLNHEWADGIALLTGSFDHGAEGPVLKHQAYDAGDLSLVLVAGCEGNRLIGDSFGDVHFVLP
jgi:hypothetical protein